MDAKSLLLAVANHADFESLQIGTLFLTRSDNRSGHFFSADATFTSKGGYLENKEVKYLYSYNVELPNIIADDELENLETGDIVYLYEID